MVTIAVAGAGDQVPRLLGSAFLTRALRTCGFASDWGYTFFLALIICILDISVLYL
jgi:hypothetical protein